MISQEGIQLVEITKPNNIDDATIAKILLKKLKRVYGQKKGRIFIADASYNKRWLYDSLVKKMKTQAFIPINRCYKQPHGLFTENGYPICAAGLGMKYSGLSPKDGRNRKKSVAFAHFADVA